MPVRQRSKRHLVGLFPPGFIAISCNEHDRSCEISPDGRIPRHLAGILRDMEQALRGWIYGSGTAEYPHGHPGEAAVRPAAGADRCRRVQDWGPSGLQPGGGGGHGGRPPGVRSGARPAGVRRGPPVLCPQDPHPAGGADGHPSQAGGAVRLPQAPGAPGGRFHRRTRLQRGVGGLGHGPGPDAEPGGLLRPGYAGGWGHDRRACLRGAVRRRAERGAAGGHPQRQRYVHHQKCGRGGPAPGPAAAQAPVPPI